MQLIRVGVDLAKNVFQLHCVDRSEKTAWRRKLVRGDWIKALLDKIEPGCEIGMKHVAARTIEPESCKQRDIRWS